jgi:hypothetical protein
MKALSFLAVFLFAFGYWICDFVYPDNLLKWWDLRIFIYTIIFGIVFWIGYELTEGTIKDIFLVGIVFVCGDVMDRYCFNINKFNANDLLLFLFAIVYLIYKPYARKTKANP